MKHLSTCLAVIIDNNYKQLIILQRVNFYLIEAIKTDELIKLANQVSKQIKCALMTETAKITAILIFESKK